MECVICSENYEEKVFEKLIKSCDCKYHICKYCCIEYAHYDNFKKCLYCKKEIDYKQTFKNITGKIYNESIIINKIDNLITIDDTDNDDITIIEILENFINDYGGINDLKQNNTTNTQQHQEQQQENLDLVFNTASDEIEIKVKKNNVFSFFRNLFT